MARIGPNLLLTDDPVFLRRISAARSSYCKGEWYDSIAINPHSRNTFAETDEEKHTLRRAQVANGYSGKDIPHLEESIDKITLDLIYLIENTYLSAGGKHRVMDWALVAHYFTLDILTDIAFSSSLGCLKQNSDVSNHIATMESFMPIQQMQANIPFVNKILNNIVIRSLVAPKPNDGSTMGLMLGMAKKYAGERFGPDAKVESDMLGSFIRHGLNQEETEAEVVLQILAGTDTTATAIRIIFYHIITNPRIYNSLLQELDTAKLSRPIVRDVEARKLPYLQACIQEGLGICPPPSTVYKIVPPEGDNYNGKAIPGGTRIAASVWSLQHSKELYGEDADLFRPERWLEAEQDKLNSMIRSAELVFGSGKYGCLGKPIAFYEMNKVFVSIFLRFDFAVADPQKGFKSKCFGFFLHKNMNVVVTSRKLYKTV